MRERERDVVVEARTHFVLSSKTGLEEEDDEEEEEAEHNEEEEGELDENSSDVMCFKKSKQKYIIYRE